MDSQHQHTNDKKSWASSALLRLAAAIEGHAEPGLLTRLADELDEAVFVVDADQSILLFNRRAETITGFSRDEVIGRHCLSGFRCSSCLEACSIKKHDEVRNIQLELFRGDGTTVLVNKSAFALTHPDGSFAGAIEIFHEAQKQPQSVDRGVKPDDLRPVETLMRPLGRSVALLDGRFRFIAAEGQLRDIVGCTGNVAGRAATDFFGDELFGDESPFRLSLAAGERLEGWRASVPTPSGERHAVSLTGARFESPEGEARYLLMIRPDSMGDEDGEGGVTDFEGMTARSPAMKRIFQLIAHLHDSDATVLITGESGTGKELVARAIHARSPRAQSSFTAVNCGALPPGLLESELFGHVRGSFTGAVRDKVGRFEAAGDGTIFLDEVGDLPLPLQVKLLRVLQERTFERVGDTEPRPFVARVVAATNQNLAELVKERRFRDDLFYRLNVVPIEVPPLRERREDLEVLVGSLLAQIGRRQAKARRLSPAAMRALLSYDWPGNVRQLENALEYAMAVCEGQTIHREDLPMEVTAQGALPARAATIAAPAEDPPLARAAPTPPRPSPQEAATAVGRYPPLDQILAALASCRYRRSAAAKQLGVSRTTLWRRMKEEGLLGG